MALSATGQEVAYLSQFLLDLLQHDYEPVAIRNDNEGTIALVKKPVKHMKSKCIAILYHFIHPVQVPR